MGSRPQSHRPPLMHPPQTTDHPEQAWAHQCTDFHYRHGYGHGHLISPSRAGKERPQLRMPRSPKDRSIPHNQPFPVATSTPQPLRASANKPPGCPHPVRILTGNRPLQPDSINRLATIPGTFPSENCPSTSRLVTGNRTARGNARRMQRARRRQRADGRGTHDAPAMWTERSREPQTHQIPSGSQPPRAVKSLIAVSQSQLYTGARLRLRKNTPC